MRDGTCKVIKNEKGELIVYTPDGKVLPCVSKLSLRDDADDGSQIVALVEMFVELQTETVVELKLN